MWFRRIWALLICLAVHAEGLGPLRGCVANLKSIATGLEMYASDHQGNYPKSLQQLTPTYLKSLPTCPAAGRETYSAAWRLAGSEGFYFCCSGNHHGSAGLKVNQPTFDARNCLGPPSLAARLETLDDGQNPQAALQRCCSNLKNLATALEMFANDHQGRYPQTLGELTPAFLRKLPRCNGLDTYKYQVSGRPDNYTVHCHGKNHLKEGAPANMPRYEAMKGLRRE